MSNPDGYAVLLDDAQSAPEGFWFVGCYTKPDIAMQVAAKNKGRMVPIYFAPPSSIAFTKEDAAKLVERKARALTEEYCHGDGGPDGYTWTNKEAEWQVILLEELAEEFRNGA